MNHVKTVLLLGALTGLLFVLGELFVGGPRGAAIGLGMALVMNVVAYFFSDKIALRMYSARPVSPQEEPRMHAIVDGLVARAGLPVKPTLYRIPTPALNAFATGRNPRHASVAATDGILQALDDEELRGVLAHELAHVKNRDILISTVAATVAGAITFLARFAFFFGGGRDERDRGNPLAAVAMMIFAPLAALLIQMAISRSREYAADASAARFVGHPHGLISALQKLDASARRSPMQADPSSAHMFIVKPFSGSALMNIFSTHPPIGKRIARLQSGSF